MTETRYFTEQILARRPYLTVQLCRDVLAQPLARREQPDGRIRFWGAVLLPGETEKRILRVVTLEDGTTLHNAFIDRNYRDEPA